VLLADDSASVRTAIEHRLKMEPGITLIGEAANFQEALAMCAELKRMSYC
jgi:DNA-binding NarL/FixJ family response regulator